MKVDPFLHLACGPGINDGVGHWDGYASGYVDVNYYSNWINDMMKRKSVINSIPRVNKLFVEE